MKISIISVGKVKEKYLVDAINEYSKRISKFSKIELIVLDDEPIKDKSNDALDLEILKKEGKKILNVIDNKSFKIILDLNGKMLSSEELAVKFIDIFNYHSSDITFVIGGSLGLSDEVKGIADFRLCFSKMTFPHQLIKVNLLEQIYRCFKINNNEKYHK